MGDDRASDAKEHLKRAADEAIAAARALLDVFEGAVSDVVRQGGDQATGPDDDPPDQPERIDVS